MAESCCRRRRTDYRFEEYGDFVLSIGRLDRAKRVDLLLEAAAADEALQVVVAGDGPDRERLEQVAHSHKLNGRVEFRGRVDAGELGDLYARGRVYYAPVDEDFQDGPVRGVPVREACRDDDRRRPARSTSSPTAAQASWPEPRAAALADALRYLREHPTTAGRGAAPARPSPSASPGTPRSTACSREGRVLLALPARAHGHRRLQRAAAARIARAGRGRRAEAQVVRARRRLRLPRWQQSGVHGWIVDALQRTPGVVVLHDAVLRHLVAGLTLARKDVNGYLSAMEREAGLPGRLLALGVVDGCVPPLWSTRPEDFPLAGDVLDLAREHGLIVHSEHAHGRALAATVRSGGSRCRSGRRPAPSPPSSRATRLSAVSASSTRTSACRSCLRRSPCCAGATPARGSSSSARRQPASSWNGASRRWDSRTRSSATAT